MSHKHQDITDLLEALLAAQPTWGGPDLYLVSKLQLKLWDPETEPQKDRSEAMKDLIWPRQLVPGSAVHDILQTMLWRSGSIAARLRIVGHTIPTKAEEEQAYVLHWMLCLALEDPEGWWPAAQGQLFPLGMRTYRLYSPSGKRVHAFIADGDGQAQAMTDTWLRTTFQDTSVSRPAVELRWACDETPVETVVCRVEWVRDVTV